MWNSGCTKDGGLCFTCSTLLARRVRRVSKPDRNSSASIEPARRGAQVPRCSGAQVPRCRGAQVPRFPLAPARPAPAQRCTARLELATADAVILTENDSNGSKITVEQSLRRDHSTRPSTAIVCDCQCPVNGGVEWRCRPRALRTAAVGVQLVEDFLELRRGEAARGQQAGQLELILAWMRRHYNPHRSW